MIDAMRRDYERGMTLREVGARYHYDPTWARELIIRAGGKMRTNSPPRGNYAMIQNDWNAGIPTERIAKVYGYKNIHSIHGIVYRLRKQGVEMRRRR